MHERLPAWSSDLIHAQHARRLAWLERLLALTRIGLGNVEAFAWGFTFILDDSALLQAWLARSPLERLFRLVARKLDSYGTYLVLTPDHARGAICSWSDLPKAAEHIRSNTKQESEDSPWIDSRHIVATLGIAEAPLNTQELPAFCETKWGLLLRLNPSTAPRALSYLCVEEPAELSSPLLVHLSSQLSGIFAWSPSPVEPLHIGLAASWATDLAMRDATRWLKTFTSRPKGIKAITT